MPQFLVSSCCRKPTIKFGSRRRQCVKCRRTWRVNKKKRGRKRLKVNSQMLINYLAKRKSLKLSGDCFKRRLRLSLEKYLTKTTWSNPPSRTKLIVIADAMHQVLEGQSCMVYFLLLRPVRSNLALIMPPLLVPGGESAVGWRQALDQLNPNLQKRIKALVCDGDPHLIHQARLKGWLIQRCHFHLMASLKNYASAGPLSRNLTFGKLVLLTIGKAVTSLQEPDTHEIWNLIRVAKNPKLRGRLWGLIKNIGDFRTYLKYPEFNLPTTSNTAESLIQVVRDLQYRAKGFSTKKSFLKWLNAVCLHKKTMICNGKIPTN